MLFVDFNHTGAAHRQTQANSLHDHARDAGQPALGLPERGLFKGVAACLDIANQRSSADIAIGSQGGHQGFPAGLQGQIQTGRWQFDQAATGHQRGIFHKLPLSIRGIGRQEGLSACRSFGWRARLRGPLHRGMLCSAWRTTLSTASGLQAR